MLASEPVGGRSWVTEFSCCDLSKVVILVDIFIIFFYICVFCTGFSRLLDQGFYLKNGLRQ